MLQSILQSTVYNKYSSSAGVTSDWLLARGSFWWNAIGKLTAAGYNWTCLTDRTELRIDEAARRALVVLIDQLAKDNVNAK